jgi:hypothetical protein
MHHFLHLLDKWQTLTAGLLALVAALATIRATNRAANREISAAQEQTRVAQEQIEITLRLERHRLARESRSFLAAMEAAMLGVIEDVAEARSMSEKIGDGLSVAAYDARQRVKKIAFADLRAACIRHGGLFTGQFLRLEKEIDDFTSEWTPMPTLGPTLWQAQVPESRTLSMVSRSKRNSCGRKPKLKYRNAIRFFGARKPTGLVLQAP